MMQLEPKTEMFSECPVCQSPVVKRLVSDWQERIEAGGSIPIVGCGNPWHYATASLGDAREEFGRSAYDLLSTEERERLDESLHADARTRRIAAGAAATISLGGAARNSDSTVDSSRERLSTLERENLALRRLLNDCEADNVMDRVVAGPALRPDATDRGSLDLAFNGAVAIECKHGYDACPECDS